MFKMDEDEPAVVSGDIENIVIKPESIELFFDDENPVWMEDNSEESDLESAEHNIDECCFVTSSGELVTLNNEDVVKTPFYLESYFLDNDRFRSRSPSLSNQQQIIVEIDRVTCYECDMVFCNELKLLEHLMTHIDVYRMGCNVCDKDLNLEEKFQLHMMAVTWQSIYYCDFCRKSCAGVVRSQSQPPPPGKTYMCHDCEYLTKQETMNVQQSSQLHEKMIVEPISTLPVYSQTFLKPHIPPPLPQPPPAVLPTPKPAKLLPQLKLIEKPVKKSIRPPQLKPLVLSIPKPPQRRRPLPPAPPKSLSPPLQSQSSVAEVLQNPKKRLKCESPKLEEREIRSSENTTPEVQDCYKSPPKRKENKRCRRPKPKVQVVSESMRQALKMSTRSQTREKLTRSYKCRYCPAGFTDEYALMSHLRDKHKFHKLRYVCKMCGKEFAQQRSYENHASFHELAKNHMCFVCNLAFLSKCELEQHARRYHDKSELISAYCGNIDGVALDLRKKSTA